MHPMRIGAIVMPYPMTAIGIAKGCRDGRLVGRKPPLTFRNKSSTTPPILSFGLENTGCAFRDSRNFSPSEGQSAAVSMEIPEDFSRQPVNASFAAASPIPGDASRQTGVRKGQGVAMTHDVA